MAENFNSKTVADRVAARLDLTLLSAEPIAERRPPVLPLRSQVCLPNALKRVWFLPTRQRDRRSPRQAKVTAPERGRKSHAA